MKYDFAVCDKKWQDRWEAEHAFEAKDDHTLPKFYGLIEFPYPSGAGLHVGHIKAFISMEVLSRKRRMQGYNVLFPIGFDAFGLNTENYAIKTKTHPRIVTDRNIANFTRQLKSVGYSFDWSRAVDTTDPDYYKWTQWIFLKMFEHGLVFRDRTLVNYCPVIIGSPFIKCSITVWLPLPASRVFGSIILSGPPSSLQFLYFPVYMPRSCSDVSPFTGLFSFTMKTNPSRPIGKSSSSAPTEAAYARCSFDGAAQNAMSTSPSATALYARSVLRNCTALSSENAPSSKMTLPSG